MSPPLKTAHIPFWTRAMAYAEAHQEALQTQFGVSPEALADFNTDFYFHPEDREGDIFVLDDKTLPTATAVAQLYGANLADKKDNGDSREMIENDAQVFRDLCASWGINKTPPPRVSFAERLFTGLFSTSLFSSSESGSLFPSSETVSFLKPGNGGYGDITLVHMKSVIPDSVPNTPGTENPATDDDFPLTPEQEKLLADLFPDIEFEIADPPVVSKAEKAVFGAYVHLRLPSIASLLANFDWRELDTHPKIYAQKLLILACLTRRAVAEMLEAPIRLNKPANTQAEPVVVNRPDLYLQLKDVISIHGQMTQILNGVFFIFSQEGFPVSREAVEAVLQEWSKRGSELEYIQNHYDGITANMIEAYNGLVDRVVDDAALQTYWVKIEPVLTQLQNFLCLCRHAFEKGYVTVADFLKNTVHTFYLNDLDIFASYDQQPLFVIPVKLFKCVFAAMGTLIDSGPVGQKLAEIKNVDSREYRIQFLQSIGQNSSQRRVIREVVEQVLPAEASYPWIEEWQFLMEQHQQAKEPENLANAIVQLAILAKNTPRVIAHYLAHRDEHLGTAIQAATDGLAALELIKKYQKQTPSVTFEGFEELQETLTVHQKDLGDLGGKLNQVRQKMADLPVSGIEHYKPAMDTIIVSARTLFYDVAHGMEFFSSPYALRLVKEAQKLVADIRAAHEKWVELLPDDKSLQADQDQIILLDDEISLRQNQIEPGSLTEMTEVNLDSLGQMENVTFDAAPEVMTTYFITGQMPPTAMVRIIF